MHTIEIGHKRHISTIVLYTSAIHVDSRCKIQDRTVDKNTDDTAYCRVSLIDLYTPNFSLNRKTLWTDVRTDTEMLGRLDLTTYESVY